MLQKALDLLIETIQDKSFKKCSFSSPRNKSQEIKKIIINPVNNLEEIQVEFQLTKHNNIRTLTKNDFIHNELAELLPTFKQCLVQSDSAQWQILINSKQQAKIITKELQSPKPAKQSHNREKTYLIPDGEACPFLIEIGVMDSKGKVKSNHYKKFRQINRFLELVDNLYKDDKHESIHIVDFGCGKSYLTFALYHYFKIVKGMNISITGVDLKEEVIEHCNQIAKKLEYSELKFVHGQIHEFQSDQPVDFVVTLHACDTATDEAILFSLRNKAQNMMFVPCCQHELNKQLCSSSSEILLKHGLFKERMTALVTDTMRSQLMEACGYKVKSVEFTSLEHTAKNILLRCQKVERSKSHQQKLLEKYQDFKNEWSINPYLERQLLEEGFISQYE